MSLEVVRRATLDDLLAVDGKAELIGGRIVHTMPTGYLPGMISLRICQSLDQHAKARRRGQALPDGVGYSIDELPSGRESFCPDASYYDGPPPANLMRFIHAAPTFAVEVRSESDYRPGADEQMAAKRADYFAAGTLAVWDVDTLNEMVYCYRASDPENAVVCQRGAIADAEPAVPGWKLAVNDLFTR